MTLHFFFPLPSMLLPCIIRTLTQAHHYIKIKFEVAFETNQLIQIMHYANLNRPRFETLPIIGMEFPRDDRATLQGSKQRWLGMDLWNQNLKEKKIKFKKKTTNLEIEIELK